MDRRAFSGLRILRRLAALSSVCLLLGTMGCAQLDEISSGRIFGKDSNKRVPKATTCVAYADLRASLSNEPNCEGVERDMVRDEARRAYQQAVKLDPQCLPAYLGLGRHYQAMEKYDNAVETYQRGLHNMPREKQLWFEMGMCQARHKEWDPALDSLRMATQLDPENPVYNNMLGFCLARAGRYDECLTLFTRTQGEAKAHYNLARMLQHVNRPAECKHHLRLAMQADPQLTAAREMLVALENGKLAAPTATAEMGAAPGTKAVLSVSFDDNIDEAALLLDN
ncbi:MAG: tetratricopeptide repeat protein [Gemmataceae bacterium]